MQATSDKTASANFTQTGETINFRGIANNLTNTKNGYSPYYQWGRKDAFRSWEYTAAPVDGTSLIYKQEEVNVATTIQHPTTFYNNNTEYNPYIPFYLNAWNATYTTYSTATTKIDGLEKVVKTVYDPCPVGYTVPPANTFYGFTNDNFPVNGSGRQYTSNGEALYLPFYGRRHNNNGTLGDFGVQGVYWSAISGERLYARSLYFDSRTTVNPASCTDGHSRVRSNGLAIRPVREN